MRFAAAAASLLVLGCAPQSTQPPPAPDRQDPCRLMVGADSRLDTVTVALLEPVDLRGLDNARSPTNDSERILFRNLFQSLVRLDCQQSLRPGLAESWTADSGGQVWTFTVRDGSSSQQGRLVTVEQIVAGLTGPAGKALGIDSAVVLDQRHLRVSLRRRDSTPSLLADPSIAVLPDKASAGKGAGGRISIPPMDGGSVVDFHVQPNADARDALDQGADLVVTRDPALVEYARGQPEFTTFPLPWSRTYLLLQPAGSASLDIGMSPSERQSLAEDAVRADARVAQPPFWWSELAECPLSAIPGSSTSSRVVYTQGDEVARELAERLVALAKPGTGLRTEAVRLPEFIELLQSGAERAYVVAVPHRTLARCHDATTLPAGARMKPLIDTRAYAIVRKGAPALSVDWDGALRIAEP